MKKSLLLITASIALSLSSFSQGYFAMIWYDGVHGISVWPSANSPFRGDLLGSEYSAEAFLGPVGATRNSLTPLSASLVSFDLNGPTRSAAEGGTVGAGSGQFYVAHTIDAGLPLGDAAIQIRAWYNGGQFATYEAAAAAGRHVGLSPIMTIALKTALDPTFQSLTDIGMATFEIGVTIPEPSTLALAGLGITSLFLFRRRR